MKLDFKNQFKNSQCMMIYSSAIFIKIQQGHGQFPQTWDVRRKAELQVRSHLPPVPALKTPQAQI